MIRISSYALAGLALVACASQPVYQAADGSRYGYSDQKIEEGRFRVTYNGSSSTPRATVETFLLYRMAELTRANGFDYFIVTETDTECHTRITEATAGGPCACYRDFGARFPYYGYGYYCDPFTQVYETKRYEAVAFIKMYTGEKPVDDPHAFDASDVIANLSPEIVRKSS